MPNDHLADGPLHLDMSALVGTVAGVLMQPFGDFIAALHAAGRVTDEELAILRMQYEQREANLGDLVAKSLERQGR
jgi:hypothetical protein